MAYPNLQSFVQSLEQAAELITINKPVSPQLQIAEITDRLCKHDWEALLFENNGIQFPVLIYSMGSEKRMCMAIGVQTFDDVAKQIEDLVAGLMTPRDTEYKF